MTTTTAPTIGDTATAEQVAYYHHDLADWLPGACDYLGSGEHRTVYIDWDTSTVYKVGLAAANRREHRVLTDARLDGATWAPATELFEFEIASPFGDTLDCTVIAMPYLPEDGSVDHAGVVIPAAGDLNPANVTAHGGQLWLIDAGGM